MKEGFIMITISCPSCGTVYNLDKSKGECPNCEKEVEIFVKPVEKKECEKKRNVLKG
jgi:uncharacterized Zn finger protein (UPF0148 family)